jgi:hypothetical protein
MPLPPPPIRQHSTQANNTLLIKGLLSALVGVLVLLPSYLISSPDLQEAIGQAALVGWFGVLVGFTLLGVSTWRRFSAKPRALGAAEPDATRKDIL